MKTPKTAPVVVQSSNPCPFCGRTLWETFDIDNAEKSATVYTGYGPPLVDIDFLGLSIAEDAHSADICVKCGATCVI